MTEDLQLTLPFRTRAKDDPVILVDMMNLAFRCHFVHGELSSQGRPTGVMYGVLKALLALRRFNARVVFCWDDKTEPNWRYKYWPEYKAGRSRDPEIGRVVMPQLKRLRKVLRVLGCTRASVPGLEADDLIGILSARVAGKVYIFSTDHDFYQLAEGERVRIIRPRQEKGEFRVLDQRTIEDEYGFPIERFTHFLALGGDSADNVRPIPRFGEKRASALVQAGARADKPWREQGKSFRKRFAKLEPHWERVLAAYDVVAIPRSEKDERVASYVQGTMGIVPGSRGDRDARLKWFTSWCADHDMSEFLHKRREFFECTRSSLSPT